MRPGVSPETFNTANNMFVTSLQIEVAESSSAAPDYKTDFVCGLPAQGTEVIKALIVPRGMVSGKPTVDLQMYILGPDGGRVGVAVVMLTHNILMSLAAAVKGVADRTAEEDAARKPKPEAPEDGGLAG